MAISKEQKETVRREVGRLLNDLRVRARKKRPAIAKEVGVAAQAVDAWESGKATISLQYFDRAAKAYGMTEEEKKRISEMIFSNGTPQVSAVRKLCEAEIFAGFIALPAESRKRILAAMAAYDGD